MESPPFESSPPAGFPPLISLFSSSISLIASISRPIRMFSPNSLCPLLGFLARSNPSDWRAIALLNAFEFFAFEARFEFPPLRAVLLLGYLHPLLPARWKSPARKYRRRRGNGGRTGGQRGKGIRTRTTQALRIIHGRRGKGGKKTRFEGLQKNS